MSIHFSNRCALVLGVVVALASDQVYGQAAGSSGAGAQPPRTAAPPNNSPPANGGVPPNSGLPPNATLSPNGGLQPGTTNGAFLNNNVPLGGTSNWFLPYGTNAYFLRGAGSNGVFLRGTNGFYRRGGNEFFPDGVNDDYRLGPDGVYHRFDRRTGVYRNGVYVEDTNGVYSPVGPSGAGPNGFNGMTNGFNASPTNGFNR